MQTVESLQIQVDKIKGLIELHMLPDDKSMIDSKKKDPLGSKSSSNFVTTANPAFSTEHSSVRLLDDSIRKASWYEEHPKTTEVQWLKSEVRYYNQVMMGIVLALRLQLATATKEFKEKHPPSDDQPSSHIIMMLDSVRRIRWYEQHPGSTEMEWLLSEIQRFKNKD